MSALCLAAVTGPAPSVAQCDLSTLAEIRPQGADVALCCPIDVYLGTAYYDYEDREELGASRVALALQTAAGTEVPATMESVEELSLKRELRNYDPWQGCAEVVVGRDVQEVRHYRLTPVRPLPAGTTVEVIDRGYPDPHGRGIVHGRFATTSDASLVCDAAATLEVPNVCFLSDSCVERN